MVRDKVRIRFRKTGALRLISHHDLMRCFERMLRRAALPFHSTEGFNPKPRLVFAMPLPLGVVGCAEVAELELDDELPAEEVRDRLARQAPPGLEILSARRIPGKVTAHVRKVCYRVAVPDERAAHLEEALAALLAAPTCWVERSRPRVRRIDVRPYLHEVRLLSGALEVDVLVTPGGTARPEDYLQILGLGDLLEAGAVCERTRMEIEDESNEERDVN
jgi:radical SAM-linked protein